MIDLRWKKNTVRNKIILIVFFVFFLIEAFMHIYPILWAINNSLKTMASFVEDPFGITKEWKLDNFVKVFTAFRYGDKYYLDMLVNSLWILVVRVFVNVASSAMLAYVLARFRFPGKELLYSVVIFANIIPIVGSGAAAYKMYRALHMVNSPWLIWIGWASGFDFAFIVFYGTFKGISQSYSESAKIDGAGDLRVFFEIVLPQAFPCIVAIAIQQAIGVWNDYGTVMVYLREYPNLAYGMYLFNTEVNYVEDSKPIYFAAAVISSIPVIVLYSCTQKLILTNITAGGLKG